MLKLSVIKYGDSYIIELSEKLLKVLDAEDEDIHTVEIARNTIILKNMKEKEEDKLTVEVLFSNYDGTKFHSAPQLKAPVGNEQW